MVRQAALRALGELGGKESLDVLVRAIGSGDARLKTAAAEGLATLRAPEAVPYLMSVFRLGRRSQAFEAAQHGLLLLGPAAHDELFIAMRAPSPELRRDAALLLARQGVAQSAPVLIRVLSDDENDGEVAEELAVLTCVDHRGAEDPAEQWYGWWDVVDRDAPLDWFPRRV
jgi:HEAT repeat protein